MNYQKYYEDLIIAFVKKHGFASRSDIDYLILNKLPDILTDDQKERKIANMLSEMRRKGLIRNSGSRKRPKWVLTSK